MGDLSRCSHGGFFGYCDQCNPNWQAELDAIGEATMSIKRCNKHGNWECDVWDSCPRCSLALIGVGVSEKEENPRKTFLGMTAVSWYFFLYIAAVLIAMAWIFTAKAGGQ